MSEDKQRTLKNMPVANKELYEETAMELNVPIGTIVDCITEVGQFCADTIRKGAYETVMIPQFGKFIVKGKVVQHMSDAHAITKMVKRKKQ